MRSGAVKRPRWLGGEREAGRGSAEGPEGDEEGRPQSEPARPAPRLADRKQGGDAGGSSRAARRRLADRVGRAGDDQRSGGAKSGEPPPEADHDAEAGAAGTERRGAARRSPRPAQDEPAAKLNRPRRQPQSPAKQAPTGDGKGEAQTGPESRKPTRPRRRKPAGEGREPAGAKGREPAEPKGREPVEPKDRKPPESGDRKLKDRKPESEDRKPEGRKRRRGAGDGRHPGRRAKAGAATLGAALRRGAAATRKRAAAAAPRAGRRLLVALAAVFALFLAALGFALNLLIAAARPLVGPLRTGLGFCDRAARAASRALTPVRALAIVVAGAAILLALSQYADYRTVSIGNDAYSGVQTVAPAPETGRLQTGDPHSYLLVPVAIACLLLLVVATVGRRWRACRLITLAGIATVAVALIVDRPAGLDPGDAAVAFEGVRATLIGGFYAEIAAGVLLIASSTLLARELHIAAAGQPATARARRRERVPGRALRRPRPDAERDGTARA